MLTSEFRPNRKRASYVSIAMGAMIFLISTSYNSLPIAVASGVAVSAVIKLMDEFQIWLTPKLLKRILKKYSQHSLVTTGTFRITNEGVLVGNIDKTEIQIRPFINGSLSVLFQLSLDFSTWENKPGSQYFNEVFGKNNYQLEEDFLTISDWSVLWNASKLDYVISRIDKILNDLKVRVSRDSS